MKNLYSEIVVSKEESILSVLKKMDKSKRKLLIVLDDNLFVSVISIGDIQRAIIKNIDINSPISKILRSEIRYASTSDNISEIKERMKVRRNELMPVVSPNGELNKVIFWEDLFDEGITLKVNKEINLPVIIMAGGQGARLKPLTNILPKPLIPINEKTIIENIMDRFVNCGCHHFFLSVNYKAELIRYYFESINNPNYYSINYFQEEKPLGTAGSLFLLKDQINTTFFVSNCDIVIEQDYLDILNYHRENKNEITLVAALKTYDIPYGTLSTGENGLLESIQEKPKYTFKINTGFYILEPHLLNEIPANNFFHITTLIEMLHNQKRRVGVFPISERSWYDIGNWNEYINMIS